MKEGKKYVKQWRVLLQNHFYYIITKVFLATIQLPFSPVLYVNVICRNTSKIWNEKYEKKRKTQPQRDCLIHFLQISFMKFTKINRFMLV